MKKILQIEQNGRYDIKLNKKSSMELYKEAYRIIETKFL